MSIHEMFPEAGSDNALPHEEFVPTQDNGSSCFAASALGVLGQKISLSPPVALAGGDFRRFPYLSGCRQRDPRQFFAPPSMCWLEGSRSAQTRT
jgi:hypothetical protein